MLAASAPIAARSAAVSVPLLRAITTGTGVWLTPWNGAASRAARRFGLLAGSELVLLCLATLASDGRYRLARTAAAAQATTMTQRKRTANRPAAAKNSGTRNSPYCQAAPVVVPVNGGG